MLSFYVSFFRCVLGTAAVAVAAGGGDSVSFMSHNNASRSLFLRATFVIPIQTPVSSCQLSATVLLTNSLSFFLSAHTTICVTIYTLREAK